MKKLLLFIGIALTLNVNATIHAVATSGFTFSPSTINASVGDTVIFSIAVGHTATEVSNATWTANGNTPLGGGFNFSPPGNSLVLTSSGTRYFVCSIHNAMGMKGIINVAPTGLSDSEKEFSIRVYPNPTTDFLTLDIASNGESASIEIVNLLGSKVLTVTNNQSLFLGIRKIDVSALHKGVYFLNIVTENRTKSIRFVKK